MASIPKRVETRLVAGIKKFQSSLKMVDDINRMLLSVSALWREALSRPYHQNRQLLQLRFNGQEHAPQAMRVTSILISIVLFGTSPMKAQTDQPAASAAATQAPAGLTNQDILKMVQAGLGEAVVLATVRTASATSFDLSPDGLIALKKGGVSDAIVSVMIDPKATPTPTSSPVGFPLVGGGSTDTRARIDSSTASPEIPRETGIYWDKGQNGNHNLIVMEPTVFSQGKTGGVFTSALTYGIKKMKMKAVIRGSSAVMRIGEARPTFYFYFESKGSGLGGMSGWLTGATSPNEFILAKMTSRTKSNDRELIVGEFGTFGGSSGTRAKDTIDVEIDRLSGGIYRVRPAVALGTGEYCFFQAGGAGAMAAAGGKLFDFGIQASNE